jgi:hypothetical protein
MIHIQFKKPCFFKLTLGIAIFFSGCTFFNSFDPKEFTIDSIAFHKTAISLAYGSMDMLSLTIEPASAQADAGVAWEFDDAVILGQADNFGLIMTGVNPGETIVRAKAYGKTATCVVTVTPGSGESFVANPYVYSSAEYVEVAPGATVKTAGSLYGGTGSDSAGFSFAIDKPSVASLSVEGNYCWITGISEGIAKVTIRHTRASYGYSFLVSCQPDGRSVPYITTSSNILTLNRSFENEASFLAELRNPPDAASEGLFSYVLLDAEGNPLPDPPASIFTNGKQCAVTPLRSGDCLIRLSHPAALYPLDVLVRVVEQIDTVYIEPSAALVSLSGTNARTVSLSLHNLPSGISSNIHDYAWTFPPDAADYIEWRIYGGDAEGKGDTAWLTGKKRGTARIEMDPQGASATPWHPKSGRSLWWSGTWPKTPPKPPPMFPPARITSAPV